MSGKKLRGKGLLSVSLLAVAFTATLMFGGQAWAATTVIVNNGTKWQDKWDGTGSDVTITDAVNITSTDGDHFIGSISTASEPATGNPSSITLTATGKTLHIGSNSDGDATGRAVDITSQGAITITDGTIKIYDGSKLTGTNLVLTATASTLDNAGEATINDVTATTGKIINSGTLTLTDGTKAAALATALSNNTTADMGTVKIADNGALAAFAVSDATGGKVKIEKQATASTNAITVGDASVELNGGEFSGVVTAKKLTFTGTDKTTYTTTSDALDEGYIVASGAEVQFATGTDIAKSAGTALTNAGTVTVASGDTLILGGNYTSDGGTIDNTANASTAGVTITTTADTGDSAGDDILDDLARAEGGDIGNVTITNERAAAISVAAQDGKVTLNGNQGTAIAVDVGGADLVLNNGTANKYSNVTAASINVAGAGGAEFSGAVTGDLDADKTTAFKANSSFTGAMDIATSTTVTVETGSVVTVNDFTTAGATGVLANAGGDLTVNGTVTGAATGSLALGGAGTTTLNGTAAGLLEFAVDGSGNIGTVNVAGDVGDKAIALSGATGGTVNFDAKQASNQKAIDVNAATINFNAGATDSVFGTGTVKATGGVNINNGASVTFGGGGASTFAAGTAVKVKSGGTMIVGSDGVTAGTGGIDVAGNATLQLDGTLALAANTLNVATDSNITTSNASDGDTLITADDYNSFKLNGTTAANDDEVSAYLATKATKGFTESTGFDWDGSAVTYSLEQTPNTAEALTAALTDVLEASDSGDMAAGLTTSAITAWAGVIKGDYAAAAGQGQATKNLMTTYFNGPAVGGAEMQSVVSTLAGFDAAKSLDIAMVTANNVTGRINARVADNNLARAQVGISSSDAMASAILNNSFANRFWIGGFGLWEEADKSGWDNGYKYNSGGFITGYDRVFGPVTVGGSFAYTAGSYEDKNALASDSSIDSYAFNLYATYNHCSGFFATIMGGYTYSDYDMNNFVSSVGGWDRSDFGADTWSIGGTVGYDIRPVQRLTITPSIGLYYYTSKSDTYNSTIRNGLKVEQDSSEMPIDLSVAYDIPVACGNLRLTANTGYAYRFSKDGGNLNEFGYNGISGVQVEGIQGRENARHTWNIGAGATYSKGRFDVGVKYDYYAKKDYKAHRVLGTVGISF